MRAAGTLTNIHGAQGSFTKGFQRSTLQKPPIHFAYYRGKPGCEKAILIAPIFRNQLGTSIEQSIALFGIPYVCNKRF
eukprot:796415-Amphidinium_carterae.1